MNRTCPRCHGWLIVEDGFIHCLACGYVAQDEQLVQTGFLSIVKRGELYQRQLAAIENWKSGEITNGKEK